MPNIINEEIRVMQNMVSHLRRAIPLEESQSKKKKMRDSVAELESLIEQKLVESGEFQDVRLEEDIY